MRISYVYINGIILMGLIQTHVIIGSMELPKMQVRPSSYGEDKYPRLGSKSQPQEAKIEKSITPNSLQIISKFL